MAISNSIGDQELTSSSTPKFTNVTLGISSTVTSGGTLTLTVSSAQTQILTGSTTETVVLPVVSTLNLNQTFRIINTSSGNVTVQSSGLNTIQVMGANSALLVTCISNSGTGTSSWLATYNPLAPFSFPLAPSLGGTGIANSDANTLTINGVSSINQDVTTTGTPSFTGVVSGSASGAASNYFQSFSQTSSLGSLIIRSNNNGGNFASTLTNVATSGIRTWSLPDASGTVALTSNIPSLGDFTFTGDVMSNATTNANLSIVPNGTGQLGLGYSGPFIGSNVSFNYVNIAFPGKVSSVLQSSYLAGNGSGCQYQFFKSRSSVPGVFSAVANTDRIFEMYANGDDGTQFITAARIRSLVSGAVSTGIVPASIEMATTNTSGALVTALTISNAQVVTLANALIAPGSTYTKVNGTESSNAVTANGSCGVITTSSLSTAGGSSYAITWTNSAITSTSVITLCVNGGTNTVQNISMTCVPGSGTATLTIYNNTVATALTGTILIGYVVH